MQLVVDNILFQLRNARWIYIYLFKLYKLVSVLSINILDLMNHIVFQHTVSCRIVTLCNMRILCVIHHRTNHL